MRSIFPSFLLNPLLRHCSAQTTTATTAVTIATTSTFRIPILEYPICRRNFANCSPQKHNIGFNMADASKEEPILNGVEESDISGRDNVESALPKLSAAEFRAYNSMAEHMDYFHQYFRQTWSLLYSACENNKRPAGYSLKQFIAAGLQLVSSLTGHHNIEEMHIFPVLARKMPEFKQGHNAAELLRQHKEIHKGMDGFEEYLRKCKSGETEFELKVLKTQMDTWGEVLWKHLDQEVKTLGAENMRKYWSVEEMKRMPM